MSNRNFIFIAGLHRSGTSLLHEVFRDHPDISGMSGTDVPEDEGQFLQTVFSAARAFGGPGKFAFDGAAHMDESHSLATPENAAELFRQWSNHFDLTKRYLVEKSPPTLIRTRYFQEVFPASKFIVILRHPVAVAYATRKMSKTSIPSLLDHSLRAYEIFQQDFNKLRSVQVIRYEEFVVDPQGVVNGILKHLELEPMQIRQTVRSDVNKRYFEEWARDKRKLLMRLFRLDMESLEQRANNFGYSVEDFEHLRDIPWFGDGKK